MPAKKRAKKTRNNQQRTPAPASAVVLQQDVTEQLPPPIAWINGALAQCRHCEATIEQPQDRALTCSDCHSQSALYCSFACQQGDHQSHQPACQTFCELTKLRRAKKKRSDLLALASQLVLEAQGTKDWKRCLVLLESAFLARLECWSATNSKLTAYLFLKVVQLCQAGLPLEARSTQEATMQQAIHFLPSGGDQTEICAQAYRSLGILHHALQDWERAQWNLEAALAMRRAVQVQGPIAESLHSLALLCYDFRHYQRALEHWQEAAALAKKASAHQSYITAQEYMAKVYHAQADQDPSFLSAFRECYHTALRVQKKQYGECNEDYILLLQKFAELCFRVKSVDEAEGMWNDALAIIQANTTHVFRANHPQEAEVLLCLAALNDDRGSYSLARSQYERSLAIVEDNFGTNNDRYREIVKHLEELPPVIN